MIRFSLLRRMVAFPGLFALLVCGASPVDAQRLDFGIESFEPVPFGMDQPAPEADGPADDAADIVEPGEDALVPDEDVSLPADLLPPTEPTGEGLPWRFADLFDDPGQMLSASGPQDIGTIRLIYDAKVERHIRFFNIAIRDRFEQWLLRLARYRPTVETIFSEFELPSDLVFLSLVESGFNPHAYSRARATGPWQFMKATAKLYGLRVDAYVDERRDPIKSTVAAAQYLRDLYDLFGTWPLAMAAYNAGEGRVMRALHKTRADTFWEIAQTRHLRRETREYVPRFMAAAIIAKNPDRYGFSQGQPELHQFEEVIVTRPIHLRDLAAATGLSFVELRQLNPELRRQVTPPDVAAYHLKVPVGSKAAVEQTLDRVKIWTPPQERTPPSKRWVKFGKNQDRADSGWYRVRMGDSLWTIARRFGLSVQELKELNKLSGRRVRIRPGDLLDISR